MTRIGVEVDGGRREYFRRETHSLEADAHAAGCDGMRIGSKAVVSVLERDPRCKMVTLDPDTAESSPEVLRKVAKAHDGMAGVYGAVLVEGSVRPGDTIELLS